MHELRAETEASDVSVDRARGSRHRAGASGRTRRWAAWPHRCRRRPTQTLRAIANLAAIAIEKARALDEASRAESARQSEALKSALLDSLAHDIKTPLTSIKAAVTSLLGDAREAGERELLTIIDEEADRLNRLAAEVVAMARIEAGKLHLEKQPVAVADLDCRRARARLPADGRAW